METVYFVKTEYFLLKVYRKKKKKTKLNANFWNNETNLIVQ